jgi:hypothetical protein
MPSHIYHIQVLLEPQRAVVGHAYLPACYRHGPSFPQQCMVLLGFLLQDMSLCSLQSQCRAHRSQHTLQVYLFAFQKTQHINWFSKTLIKLKHFWTQRIQVLMEVLRIIFCQENTLWFDLTKEFWLCFNSEFLDSWNLWMWPQEQFRKIEEIW